MMTDNTNAVRRQAILLARDNKRAEPGIQRVYWFPHEEEVRLVEVEDGIPASASGVLEPFYFAQSLRDNLNAPSAVALIRTDEFGKLELPQDWGDWDCAKELEIEK